jgi:hypothetical protein
MTESRLIVHAPSFSQMPLIILPGPAFNLEEPRHLDVDKARSMRKRLNLRQIFVIMTLQGYWE